MPRSEELRRIEELLNQRVSMNFIDADLDYVLQTLFKISGVNILAEQSLVTDKKLTLHVEDIPLKEILEFIKRNYEGVEYTVTESAVWLTSPEKPPLRPRWYPLSRGLVGQGAFQMGARSSTRTPSSSGSTGIDPRSLTGSTPQQLARALAGRGSPSAPGGGGGGGGGGGVGGQAGSGETHLEAALKWIESWEDEWPPGSTWQVDRQTNTLMVLTTQAMHDRIEELLDVIDTVPVQVRVRTKFIEVLADDLKEYGLSTVEYTEWTERTLVDGQTPEGTRIGTSGMGTGEGGLQFQIGRYLSDNSQLIAALNALEKKQRARVLSQPQIIAMNNTRAVIDVSKSIPYVADYTTTSTSVLNPDSDQVISIPNVLTPIPGFVDVGFFLEFVPSVGRDRKNIVLDLHARVDDNVGFAEFPVTVGGLSSDAGAAAVSMPTVKEPIIDAREFQTRLVVEDGGMVVIGGLVKNFQETVRRRVPVLGDIPLIGLLFRYQREETRQSNMIIVVQAEIVAPSGQRYEPASSEDEVPGGMTDVQQFGDEMGPREWLPDLPPRILDEVYQGGVR
jgi:general secretion pathway protein D